MRELLVSIKIGFIVLLSLLMPLGIWSFLLVKLSYFLWFDLGLSTSAVKDFIPFIISIITIPILIPIYITAVDYVIDKFD